MIDPKELRIGNFLKCRDDKAHGEVLEICYIGKDGAATINGWSYKEWSAIPLTAELLEKAGFEFLESPDPPYEVYAHSKVDQFEVWNFNDEHWILDMADQNGIDMSHFKYLHQLQNLFFALTGQELEISI
jgi:hypothetical protein